jgi:Tol biopolymer transport system component
MKTRKVFIVIILCVIVQYSFGQQFTDLYGDYLGQTPPGDTPVVFARGIVSTELQNHGFPSFTPDGNEVFWQENRCPKNDNEKWDIKNMTMRCMGGRWTMPEVSSYGSTPIVSPDGKQLYFGSSGEGNDPHFYEKQDDTWIEGKSISLVSRFPELKFVYNLSVTLNGTLYFISLREGLGTKNNYGIFRMELINGEYAKPELLPTSINMPGALNWTPFIAPDESYLLFSSNRSGSLDEYGDLYISFRKYDGSWTDVISMGATINSNQQERFPAISPDGKYLFFTRWTSDYDEDVFWVSAKIIDHIKKEVFNSKVTK